MTHFQPGVSGNPNKKWQPGVSGNPKGRPPRIKYLSEYAYDLLAEVIDPATGKTRAQEMAETWLLNAIASPALFLELLNRVEGRLTSQVDVTSKGETLTDHVSRLELEQRLLVLFETVAERAALPASGTATEAGC